MYISIIICTYNQCRMLQSTLESILNQKRISSISFELLIIDNNSNDSTKDVVAQFKNSVDFPVRYVFEERQGLSFARNRGVTEARGEIAAFTDDDVRVESDWLVNIEKAFAKQDIACAGGKILPIWEKERPAWLTNDIYKYLALRNLGDEALLLSEPKIFGANFIVRSSMFDKYGAFDTSIGRTKGKYYAGEEYEFVSRVLAGGEKVFYLPDLVVHHFIPVKRMQKRYFRKWVYDNSELYAMQFCNTMHRCFIGVPLYIIKEFIEAVLKYIISHICFKHAFTNELTIIRTAVFGYTRIKYKLTEVLNFNSAS